MSGRVVLVPGVPALLPEHAGLEDPVAALRAACRSAVAWLCEPREEVTVHASAQGLRIARHLVEEAGGDLRVREDRATDDHPGRDGSTPTLVVGNGSARRTEKAPGHLDPRAEAYDEALGRALLRPDPVTLARLDLALADELWADVGSLRRLGALTGAEQAVVDYADAPYGVQYWVLRWTRDGAAAEARWLPLRA